MILQRYLCNAIYTYVYLEVLTSLRTMSVVWLVCRSGGLLYFHKKGMEVISTPMLSIVALVYIVERLSVPVTIPGRAAGHGHHNRRLPLLDVERSASKEVARCGTGFSLRKS